MNIFFAACMLTLFHTPVFADSIKLPVERVDGNINCLQPAGENPTYEKLANDAKNVIGAVNLKKKPKTPPVKLSTKYKSLEERTLEEEKINKELVDKYWPLAKKELPKKWQRLKKVDSKVFFAKLKKEAEKNQKPLLKWGREIVYYYYEFPYDPSDDEVLQWLLDARLTKI